MNKDVNTLYDQPDQAKFIKAVIAEIKKERLPVGIETHCSHGQEPPQWYTVLSCPAVEHEAHFRAFHPVSREWEECSWMMEEGIYMCLNDSGWAHFIEEDPDCCVEFVFKQPREVADFLMFYRNAKQYADSSPGWTTRPISDLFSTIGVFVMLDDEEPMVLPLVGAKSSGSLPTELERQLGFFLEEQGRYLAHEGCIVLGALARKHEDYLRKVCQPVSSNSFSWWDGVIEPTWGKETYSKVDTKIYLEPNPKMLSSMYALAYFGENCADNAAALQETFHHAKSLKDLREKVHEHSLVLPSTPVQQTRIALELQEIKDYAQEQFREISQKPTRARNMIDCCARMTHHLEDVDKQM